MKINELAKQLEDRINSKIEDLKLAGEKYKELNKQIEEHEAILLEIYKELKPVEYMIKFHNPQASSFFETLNKMFEKLEAIKELEEPKEKKACISQEQYENLMVNLEDMPDTAKDIMYKLNITTLRDLPKSQYLNTLTQIRDIKRTSDEFGRKKK